MQTYLLALKTGRKLVTRAVKCSWKPASTVLSTTNQAVYCVMQLALQPTDEETAARRRQEEDDMDAELFVNIGSSHV